METSIMVGFCSLLALALAGGNSSAAPMGTAITYIGQLSEAGGPVNGQFDLKFALYDADLFGNQVGPTVNKPATPVINGWFTNAIDFGEGAFAGEARWVQIAVSPAGAGAYDLLSPRRKLEPLPYALYAAIAGQATAAVTTYNVEPNAVPGAGLQDQSVTAPKIAPGEVVKSLNGLRDDVLLAPGEDVTITHSGNALTLASTNHWKLGGNAGTIPGSNFLGTTDDRELQFRVNGQLAMRIKPNGTTTPSIIGGAEGNTVGSGTVGATISGGGADLYVGQQEVNRVFADFGVVGGGSRNTIDLEAGWATIGGGYRNTVEPLAQAASIGGGVTNVIQNAARYATIGGGYGNMILSSAMSATIAGGEGNLIEANATNATGATIGGGVKNTNQAFYGTIGGGNAAVLFLTFQPLRLGVRLGVDGRNKPVSSPGERVAVVADGESVGWMARRGCVRPKFGRPES